MSWMFYMDLALSLIIHVLVVFVLVAVLVDMCMSIRNRKKTLKEIDTISKRLDILMNMPIKKARAIIIAGDKGESEKDSEKQ